ncbi:MAG: hypothetical protein HY460_01465, partial [Parcubacteria group bacterium]|nr:hypothetical protein [Parcubacteria group bacterium]
MKKSRQYRLTTLVCLSVFIFGVGGTVYAQAPRDPGENFPAPSLVAAPAGTVNCFDYYTFGSVQANIAAQTLSAVSGTPVTFSGTLTNENPYPIIDGALYVKLFRLRDSAEKNVNGPFVVDQFFVRSGITLLAGGKMPLIFTWDIPSHAPSGRYEVATFFTISKKYNLLGLSFTDDVVGNRAGFDVVGEAAGTIELDKDAVTVSGNTYRFAAFPPREDTSAPVPIEVRIRNGTDSNARATVRWQVYAWDQGRDENLVEEGEQVVAVQGGGEAVASYTVTDSRYPVYLVVGTLNWQNTQSIVNIRFVRGGIDRTRINFPGITSFPFKAFQETTLFSCLHNSGESPVVADGRLELRLSDSRGRTIHEYVYKGDVTGAMMGVADRFTLRRGYDVFTLTAKLYQNDTLVDESSTLYDCQKISPFQCLSANGESEALTATATPFDIVATFIIVLSILLLAYFFRYRRRHR